MSLISYSIEKYIVFQRFDNIKLFHHKESSIASWSCSSSLYQIHTWKLSVNGKIFAHTYIHTYMHTYIYYLLRQVGLRQPKGWCGPADNLIKKNLN